MPEDVEKTGYKYDLKDIQAKEVSLVDRAANKRKFLFRKSEDGGGDEMGKPAGSKEGGKDPNAQAPAPVLKGVIGVTQSAVEDLTLIASTLESMQADEKVQKQESPILSEELAGKFKGIIESIEGDILAKYSPAALKKKEETSDSEEDTEDSEDTADAEIQELNKSIETLTTKLGDLKGIVEKMEKNKEETVEKPDKPKTPDTGDETNDQTPETSPAKPEGEGETQPPAQPEGIKKEDLMDEIKKMLDGRATELVKLFKEAAAEEFKPLFDRVEKIEKALGGDPNEQQSADEEPYERTYGMEEGDSKVSDDANPFKSMLDIVR